MEGRSGVKQGWKFVAGDASIGKTAIDKTATAVDIF
jgi:hypothetical protein